MLAWHSGPIRLIRRVSHSVKLIFGIRIAAACSAKRSFTATYAEDSFVARVLWVPRLFFGDVRVRTWLDFVGLDGFTLAWSGMERPPFEVEDAGSARDGGGDPAIRRQMKWLALKGGGKIVMQTFTPSPDFGDLRRQLYYCDGAVGCIAASALGLQRHRAANRIL